VKAAAPAPAVTLTGGPNAAANLDRLADSLFAAMPVAGAKNRVAVLPFVNKSGQAESGQGTVVAERMIMYIQNHKTFVLIDREQFQKAMAEVALSQSGVIAEESALQAGKFLAADYLLTGSIATAFGATVVNARIMQTETGTIMASAAVSMPPVALDDIQKQLLGEKATVGGALFRSVVVPGWGQYYSDHPGQGTVALLLFLGAAGYLGYTGYATYAAHQDYDTEYNKVAALFNNGGAGFLEEVNQAMLADGLDPSHDDNSRYIESLKREHLAAVDKKESAYSDAYDRTVIAGIILGGVWTVNVIDAAICGAASKRKYQLYFSASGLDRVGLSLGGRF
jgi:TolB-like protein